MSTRTTTSTAPLPPRDGRTRQTPAALYALTAGSFGIGTTEFVIMGLLLQVAQDLRVSITAAGLLISGYALGVCVGAPLLTAFTARMPRKKTLLGLMAIFTIGNIACAAAPDYWTLMFARVLTSFAHGTFFGVGSVVATRLVPANRKASAIATMFSGLTVATLLGVPAGAWVGLQYGWRSTFWCVSGIGAVALAVIALWVPADQGSDHGASGFRSELKVLRRPQVLLGLLMTVLGFAGVFTVYTYIQPILTTITGFAQGAVSPILLLFGLGMIVGNVLGGRLADRRLVVALLGTLASLAVVLAVLPFAFPSKVAATVFTGLLGVATFATVAPLQMRVLQQAAGEGEGLASSLNIAAFNLGNALGAWLGGLVIDHGAGLAVVPFAAAAVTLSGLAVAAWSVRLDRHRRTA